MTDTTTHQPEVAFDDLFDETLDAIREGDGERAADLIGRITAAVGADPDTERPRFLAAAIDEEAEEELRDDLQTMGELAQLAPAGPAPRVFNFAIPDRDAGNDPLAHLLPPPASSRGLLG